MANAWESVAIVGVGLIGGSIGQAVRRRQLAKQILGIGRDESRLGVARDLGAIDRFSTQLHDAAEADLCVICTPVETIPRVANRLLAIGKPGLLVTDAGSTKERIVGQVQTPGRRGARFVGSHPLAGSEKGGVQNAVDDLFVDRTVVVTPADATPRDDVATIEAFWRALGARVIQMAPDEHDRVVAWTSHLPHVIASLVAQSTPEQLLPLTGTGWAGTTRVASGDVELWRQIIEHNRDGLLSCLQEFAKVLDSFTSALQRGETPTWVALLEEGKRHRDAVAD